MKNKNVFQDETIVCDEEAWKMKGICILTSVGDYEYDVSLLTSENHLHDVEAFILASMVVANLL